MPRLLSRVFLTAAVAGLGAGALADGFTRLPRDYGFPQSERSPGQVTFRHAAHVKASAPDCTSCHPRLFKIGQRGETADGAPIRHARMKQGDQCGACHGGERAFGLDECEQCHAME